MAVNFPTSPTNGQTITANGITYVYDSTQGVWSDNPVGTIDGIVIGGSTAAAGTFTTFTSNGIDDNADAVAMSISSSEDISIGSASSHAGARVVINDTPPTAFGSPMFQVGQETFTGNGMYSIGFGYTDGTYTDPPAEIAALTTSNSGGTHASIVFGTRTATINAVSERARITSAGDLLVAKTSASGTTLGPELLASGQINAASAGDFLNMYSTSGSAYRFYVTNAGTINATSTSIQAISDASLKENIRDLDKGLETINALQPRRFDWKNGGGNDIMGFVAQEVESVLPELVHEYKYTDEETKLALKMGDMVPSMVKAIQELSAQVTELKAEVAALKG